MTDRIKFDLVSDGISTSSNKSRRSYSQRNVSSLQHELTKHRKMINMKTSTAATSFNRTISFKPLPVTTSSSSLSSSSLSTNVENTPIKIIPIQIKSSYDHNASNEQTNEEKPAIEETPVKEEDLSSSEMMAREIQRLSLRLRSSAPLYNVPVLDHQPMKPATLHLSQVVNRVSRCHYVFRRYVREAEKYSPKPEEKRPLSQPVTSKMSALAQSHEKGRRRLFVDSPRQEQQIAEPDQTQPPLTPRKASGVIKQLFASPCSSLKRTLPSPNQGTTNADKRAKLF